MPKRTVTGCVHVNLALTEEAWTLLRHLAPTSKLHGRFISQLIEQYQENHEREEFRARIVRLEERVGVNHEEEIHQV